MALRQRIRTTKPEFYRHHELFKAEQETGLPLRLAYQALWTCADRDGRFEWRSEELKVCCLPYDDLDFEDVLEALANRLFVVRYTREGRVDYGWIPTFVDNQHINNREVESVLPDPLGDDCKLLSPNGIGSLGRDSHASLTRRSFPFPSLSKKKNNESTPKRPRKTQGHSEGFLTFWDQWPPRRRRKKPDAWRAWQKALVALSARDDPEAFLIGRGLDYAKSPEGQSEFVRGPSPWLNQQAWDEGDEAWQHGNGKSEPEPQQTYKNLADL